MERPSRFHRKISLLGIGTTLSSSKKCLTCLLQYILTVHCTLYICISYLFFLDTKRNENNNINQNENTVPPTLGSPLSLYLTALAALEEDGPEALAADAEEDEDDQPHPGYEDGEYGVEVPHLLPRELDVGGVGEAPHHHKQEVGDSQALTLGL